MACLALQFFPLYLINDKSFEKKLLNIQLGPDFLYAFCLKHFFMKNWARYDDKCIYVLLQSTRYSCQILIELDFSHQIFEKYSNIKFHVNPFSWSRIAPCGRAEGQTDTTKLTVTFGNFVNAPKTL
jgi:hypothetical protein